MTPKTSISMLHSTRSRPTTRRVWLAASACLVLLQGAATERAPLDALRRCMEKGKVFEGRAINYDSKKRPFVMHWRVVPVTLAKGRPAEYYIAIQRTANSG